MDGYRDITLWIKSVQNDLLGEKVNHSLTPLALQHFILLRSILLCCAPLHSTLQHAALLGGLFVREKVVMY